MAFRTVVVNSNSKLELNLNYLVHRTIDKTTKILLNEIHTIIIQSTQVAITTALICELNKNKIKIIFCDEKSNPDSEIIPYYNNHYSSKNLFQQFNWSNEIKNKIWKMIISNKIINQSIVLKKYNINDKSAQVYDFASQVIDGDVSNREGHAAKVYFNALFGKDFSRNDDNDINAKLNYGYSILLSQINREIIALGYLTQIGIHHSNVNNFFNFGCDLMEPFRPIIDDKVKQMSNNENWKKEIIDLFNIFLIIGDKKQTFYNAIKIFVESIISCLNSGDLSSIIFYEKYEL